MPGELLVLGIVEVVGGLIAHVGAEAVQARGRTFLDRRELDKLDAGAKQAFIAGVVFVGAHDGALSQAELDEIETRLKRLEIDPGGDELALVHAARDEVIAAGDDTAYAARLIERLPEGRAREALLCTGVAVALLGDAERQLAAVRLLAAAAGQDDKATDQLIADERMRLVR